MIKGITYQRLIHVFYVHKTINAVRVTISNTVLNAKLDMFYQVNHYPRNVSNVMNPVLHVLILQGIVKHALEDT